MLVKTDAAVVPPMVTVTRIGSIDKLLGSGDLETDRERDRATRVTDLIIEHAVV